MIQGLKKGLEINHGAEPMLAPISYSRLQAGRERRAALSTIDANAKRPGKGPPTISKKARSGHDVGRGFTSIGGPP